MASLSPPAAVGASEPPYPRKPPLPPAVLSREWILRISDSVPLALAEDAAREAAHFMGVELCGLVRPFNRQFKLRLPSSLTETDTTRLARRSPRARTHSFHSLRLRLNDSLVVPTGAAAASPSSKLLPARNSHWKPSEQELDRVEWVLPIIPTRHLFRRTSYSHEEARILFEKLEIHDPGFSEQWHLYNDHSRENDINVTGVWEMGVLGKGAQVCIVDDGIDSRSLDLKGKLDLSSSYDFNSKTNVPQPLFPEDIHGTRCAGTVAAPRNKYCGVGVAPEATLSGVRILSDNLSAEDEASAYTFALNKNHIFSCSFGPEDNGEVMQAPPPNVVDALIHGVEHGRNGLGAIYVFASGNGGRNNDDCNADGYANSPYTFSIGAIDRYGKRPFYSEVCASQFAVTFSGGSGGHGIYTTDVGENKCTSDHSGTSAAAPIAAGILALVISDSKILNWRTLMHLLVETSRPFDVNNTERDWQYQPWSNRYFSHYFGYGKIDSYDLVMAARKRNNVGPIVTWKSGWQTVQKSLEESEDGIVEVAISVEKPKNMTGIEFVILNVNVKNNARGFITVNLTSPNNITSRLLNHRPKDVVIKELEDWDLSSVAHWGENPAGIWKIRVQSLSPKGSRGIVAGLEMNFRGEGVTSVAEPEKSQKKFGSISTVDSKMLHSNRLEAIGILVCVAFLAFIAYKKRRRIILMSRGVCSLFKKNFFYLKRRSRRAFAPLGEQIHEIHDSAYPL